MIACTKISGGGSSLLVRPCYMILHASSKKSIIAKYSEVGSPARAQVDPVLCRNFGPPLSFDLILNILSVLDGFLVHTQLPACLLAYLGYIELISLQ